MLLLIGGRGDTLQLQAGHGALGHGQEDQGARKEYKARFGHGMEPEDAAPLQSPQTKLGGGS